MFRYAVLRKLSPVLFPAVSTDSFSEHNDPASDYQIDQGSTKRGSSEMHPYLISTAHLWFVLSDN